MEIFQNCAYSKQKKNLIKHLDKILNLLELEQPSLKDDVEFSVFTPYCYKSTLDIYIHLSFIKIYCKLIDMGYVVKYHPNIDTLWACLTINGEYQKLITYSWFKKVTKIKEKYEF